jgi:energy-coupling factor transporter ATP-binding protein EcfA2
VEDEVAFGPRNLGFDDQQVEEAVSLALALTGLGDLPEIHPYDLHPTDRRWVALASVLALRAPVLILDEPTTGLDLAGKERMASLMETLKQASHTLLLISHDMQFVAEHADYLYVMAGGQVVTQGEPSVAFSHDEALARAAVKAPAVAQLARALNLGDGVVATQQFVDAVAHYSR